MKNRHHDGIYQLKPIASITAGMTLLLITRRKITAKS